jgi:hypothetical protein
VGIHTCLVLPKWHHIHTTPSADEARVHNSAQRIHRKDTNTGCAHTTITVKEHPHMRARASADCHPLAVAYSHQTCLLVDSDNDV